MRVIYILPSLERVGPTNVVLDLVRGLSIKRGKTKIISLRGGELQDEFEKYSQVLIVNNIFSCFFAMKKESGAIFHSHGFVPDLINSIFGLFSSHHYSVSTIHNFIKLDYTFLKGRLLGTIFTLLHKMILLNIKYPISCSKSAMQFNRVSKYYVYNGVSDAFFESKDDHKTINILYLGSFNKRKNITIFLDAMLKTNNKKLKLYVVGDGEKFEDYKLKYSNNNICFVGRVDDPSVIINKCDYVISSSLAEGFPLAILESLSCGLSYVLSNIPPHKEIYDITLGLGFVINDQVNDFKLCFDNLSKNKNKSMIRKIYLEKLTVEIMVDNYRRFYEKFNK